METHTHTHLYKLEDETQENERYNKVGDGGGNKKCKN